MTNPSDSRRILDLLSQGKITVDEAELLLKAVGGDSADAAAGAPADGAARLRAAGAKWLKVSVDKPARDGRPRKQVDIRVPMALVRGGVKLGAIVPKMAADPLNKHLREKGVDVDLSKIDLSQLDAVLDNLGETTIDVDDGRAQVKITCE